MEAKGVPSETTVSDLENSQGGGGTTLYQSAIN